MILSFLNYLLKLKDLMNISSIILLINMMKQYDRIFNNTKKELKEGIDSIPKLEKEFRNYSPYEIFGSLIIMLKNTGQAKKLKSKAWNRLFDVYHDFENLGYED